MRAKLLSFILLTGYCCTTSLLAQTPHDTLTPRKGVGTAQPVDTTLHHHTVVRRVVRLPYTGGTTRARYKAQGYRIQVYTGANNRVSKQEALHFPELSAYVTFLSPRWVCRVGDFSSREEAADYVRQLRRKRISAEVRVVSSTILRAE